MTNPIPDQEKFQHFKTQLRVESLGLVEDAFNRGEITQSDYKRYRERELHRYAHTVGSFARHYNIPLLPQVPASLESLNQEEILILAYSEPLLTHWVYQWRDKHITWEQATYGIILSLLSESKFMRDRYTEIIEKHPMGMWLQPNDYTVIIKKDEWEKAMSCGGERRDQITMNEFRTSLRIFQNEFQQFSIDLGNLLRRSQFYFRLTKLTRKRDRDE